MNACRNAMGSLPNLHELGKESLSIGYKPTTALGHLCGGGNYFLSEKERDKILHHRPHHKVLKTRSCGNEPSNKVVHLDSAALEHMAGYSPISARSARNSNQIKRKDSLSSSIGATSVRRLLAVVRNVPSSTGRNRRHHEATHLNKHRLLWNLIVLCISNMFISATYLPYLALQSSVSVWSIMAPLNNGSIFLAIAHFLAGFSSLLLLPLNQILGCNSLLCLSYACLVAHYCLTLCPNVYVMLPSCLVLASALGIMVNAHTSTLITIATKLTNVHKTTADEEDEVALVRFTCLIRRTARAFRGAHDVGLILGSLVTAFAIFLTTSTTAITENSRVNLTGGYTERPLNDDNASSSLEYATFLDNIFDSVEGTRLCGSQACPVILNYEYNANNSNSVVPSATSKTLSGVYTFLTFAAVVLVGLGMDNSLRSSENLGRKIGVYRALREAFRDSRLQLMAPLMFFVGLEQAFIYADFGKSYVICTLGVHRLNSVYVAMGILQSIAACTLSMLLRSIRRYHIVGVGFIFHSCLMLVLALWKPMDDDPALFYVISAAWGVCNAIWEMLSFTLLTSQFASDRCWESAFAVASFYRFLGLSVAFTFHGFVCNYVKLYGLTFFMVVAVCTFTFLDVRLENVKKLKNISRL